MVFSPYGSFASKEWIHLSFWTVIKPYEFNNNKKTDKNKATFTSLGTLTTILKVEVVMDLWTLIQPVACAVHTCTFSSTCLKSGNHTSGHYPT